MAPDRIKLGVSACLLGQKVRYNGEHSRDRFVQETLGAFVEYLPVCPEVECGLPVPREAMRLAGDPAKPRLLTSRSGKDLTEQMLTWAQGRVEELAAEDLCGFIFKARSPSSGMARVKVYDQKGAPPPVGVGLFARSFMDRFPLLPVEEDGRLHDPRLRENFITRIFVLKRWRELLSRGRRRGGLVEFHQRHKLLLMAHSPQDLRALGRLVAHAKELPPRRLFDQYQQTLMHALGLLATDKKNRNVLMHIMGYFKKRLSREEKAELLELIDNYGRGLLPLIVPVTMLNHYVRKYDEPYLRSQVYLNPHPLELGLRNHV